MKKFETLRGRGAFDKVFASRSRVQGSQVRCVYHIREASEPVVRIGFAVPHQTGSAVRRNRIRRLMREALSRHLKTMRSGLSEAGRSADVVFIYRVVKGRSVERLALVDIEEDVVHIVRQIVKSADRVLP